MDFHTAMLRLQSAPTRALDWINQNKIDYAIRYIIDPIRDLQISRRQSQGFIDAWRVVDTGFLKLELVNDHKYADLLEYGWPDYDVYPLGKDEGGADVLKFSMNGQIMFRKHTHPRGFKGYNIISSAENWGFFDRFLERLIDGANQWLQEAKMR